MKVKCHGGAPQPAAERDQPGNVEQVFLRNLGTEKLGKARRILQTGAHQHQHGDRVPVGADGG